MINEEAWDDYDKLVKAADVLEQRYGATSLTRHLRSVAKEIVGSE